MEWNAVVTVYEGHYGLALQLLGSFAEVSGTDYFNVLALRAEDPVELLETLESAAGRDPAINASLSRVMPVTETFAFQTPQEFEERARDTAALWLPCLVGQCFHVRMHRRGFKSRLSSQEEELLLDRFLLQRLQAEGESARIGFEQVDFILALETLGQQAGMSLWSREQIQRHPLLKLD
ncbi:MAG: hypothetical protein PVI91_10640 [Gammaproteobacteria bacterium]|jgi:hypothetical protein